MEILRNKCSKVFILSRVYKPNITSKKSWLSLKQQKHSRATLILKKKFNLFIFYNELKSNLLNQNCKKCPRY